MVTMSTLICNLFCAAYVAAIPPDYDAVLERSAARWMPDYDWRWLKSQCWQESRFDPRAISPAGARGLCQFMPGTWGEAQSVLGVRDVYTARDNAGAAGELDGGAHSPGAARAGASIIQRGRGKCPGCAADMCRQLAGNIALPAPGYRQAC